MCVPLALWRCAHVRPEARPAVVRVFPRHDPRDGVVESRDVRDLHAAEAFAELAHPPRGEDAADGLASFPVDGVERVERPATSALGGAQVRVCLAAESPHACGLMMCKVGAVSGASSSPGMGPRQKGSTQISLRSLIFGPHA